MDGWNTNFLLGRPIFRGEPLVSGSVTPFPPWKNQVEAAVRATLLEVFPGATGGRSVMDPWISGRLNSIAGDGYICV